MSQLFYSNLQSIIGDSIPIILDSESVYLRFKCKYPEDDTEYVIFIEQCTKYIQERNLNIFLRIQQISETIVIFLQSSLQITKIQILEMLNDSQYNKITIFLVELTYQMIQQFITDLTEKEINYEEFNQYTTDLLERSMCFFALEFREFAQIDSKQLYNSIKCSFHSILQNIQQFLYKQSVVCNQRMTQLNELLLKYSSLANVRSYEILQTETSFHIIQEVNLVLQDQSFFFFRPEFNEYRQLIVTNSIRYFYDYSKQPYIQEEMSTLTNSFDDAIEIQELLFESKGINSQENEIQQKQFHLNHNPEYIKQQDYLKMKQERESLLANGQLAGDLYGGSIGTGIGCLIVDCTDKKMPWNQKLKRAGFSTISTGLVSVAMRLPVVGLIIQQALIVYAVGYTVSNQVVSNGQKAKNLAHVSVQGATGMGSALVGQMLIPIPVVGAIIGGTVGGVAISLYQRLVVQRNKPSIKVMLEKLLPRLQYDGSMYYDEKVLEILKINRNHFTKNQPAEFTDSQWLTILTVFLVNEIYYLYKLQIKEKQEDLQKKLLKKPNDKGLLKEYKQMDQEEEEMEIINVKWERCRILLDEMQFKILPFSEWIGSFLNGMLQNFKL